MNTARPLKVSTFGLSPDMKRVHPAFGRINRGEVSRHTLCEALEIYRRLGADPEASVSHIAIQSEIGRFIVRVSGEQLTLGAEGDSRAQAVPLAAEEIVTRVEQPPISIADRPPPPPPEPPWRMALAVVLVAAGVGLMVHALKPVLAPESARPAEDVALVGEGADIQAQQQALAGMFATGTQEGDRSLTISANGNVVFAELGPRAGLTSAADSFRIGRREDRTCLVTARNGVIEVVNARTLRYYGDTYRRLE